MKMVDRKGGQMLNIVDRKFRMTPKRQRMILKVKEMTLKKQRMTPRMVNMTPKTELLQMIYKSLTMTQ